MEITVKEQPKRFWFSMQTAEDDYEWQSVVGHEIKVGEYSFFAAALPNNILNVSEVTTGCKVFETKLTVFDLMITETMEETMVFYRDYVVEKLKEIIQKVPDFKQQLVAIQEKQKVLLGDMPVIEDVDDSFIIESLNEIVCGK